MSTTETFSDFSLQSNMEKDSTCSMSGIGEPLRYLQQKSIFVNLSHIGLTILEYIIFCCFLVGSILNQTSFKYIDIFGNAICGIKIVTFHVLLAVLNHRQEKKGHPQKQQSTNFYLNKLQLYELLQIQSIILTCLLFVFPTPLTQIIFSSLRLLRLFFPFLTNRSIKGKLKTKVFRQTFSIVFFIIIATIFFSFLMQFLLFGVDEYYCLSPTKLSQLTLTSSISNQLKSCGLFLSCSNGQQCQNIFTYVQNKQLKSSIRSLFSFEQPTFSYSIFYSISAVLSGDSLLYSKYQELFISWIWFLIVVALWLLYDIFTGIGIGQSINYERLEELKINQQKKQENVKNSDTNKVFHNKKCSVIQDMNLPSSKPLKQSPRIDDDLISMTPSPASTEFSSEIESIENDFKNRSFQKKLTGTLFNLVCIGQILLLIGDNINFDSIPNRNIGIGLGVLFIVWTFGLGFVIYKFFSTDREERTTTTTNIIIYETLAYSVMLTDYVFRIISGNLIFQQPTEVTPFAYSIISLRIMFILYNNGFDAFFSFYAQKMMLNFVNNLFLLGFLLTAGFSIGLLLSFINQDLSYDDQLQYITTGISIVQGTGGLDMGSSLQMHFISILMKFLAIITNFYIAKHIMIGYGRIVQIDMKSQSLILLNEKKCDENNKTVNWLRHYLIIVNNNHCYKDFKILIVFAYTVLTLAFFNSNKMVNISILVMDILFLFDITIQIISFGVVGAGSYFSSDMVIKLIYVISQIVCTSFFVIAAIPPEINVALRITRSFILFGCFAQLYQIYMVIKSIIFHPKLKIFKLLFIPPFLLLVGATLTSFYIGLLNINNSGKIINLMAFSISYVYNLRWGFVTIDSQTTVFSICMNMIFMCLILFFHIILTFMMVSFFVSIKQRNLGPPSTQIARRYGPADPKFYFHQPVTSQSIFRYLNTVKIVIIAISFVLSVLLSGDLLLYSQLRSLLVTLNIILFLIQVCIHFVENIFVKVQAKKWGIEEALLLLFSAPGTFLMIVPISKISTGLPLTIFIRSCLFFSTFRLLRIISTLKSQHSSIFFSKLFRSVLHSLDLTEILGIFLFAAMSILPFSVFQALRLHTSVPSEFLNFLTGSIYGSIDTVEVEQLIVKFICVSLFLFPLKTILLAKVISCFICNKPNQLHMLRDTMERVISQSKILEANSSLLFLPYFHFYRLPAQIFRIFQQFSTKTNVKCLKYNQIMNKIASLNIPVYEYESYNERGNSYGILLCDLIWHIFIHLPGNEDEQQSNMLSLYEKIQSKPPQISISHMGTLQLCAYFKVKQRMKERVKQMRIQLGENKIRKKEKHQSEESQINEQ